MRQFLICSGKELNSFAALSWKVPVSLGITSDLVLPDRSSLVDIFPQASGMLARTYSSSPWMSFLKDWVPSFPLWVAIPVSKSLLNPLRNYQLRKMLQRIVFSASVYAVQQWEEYRLDLHSQLNSTQIRRVNPLSHFALVIKSSLQILKAPDFSI